MAAPSPGHRWLDRLGLLSWWPWAILVVGLSLTLLRWQMLIRADRAHLAARHALEAHAIVDRLNRRFDAFTFVLKGASSYVARVSRPTRSEWRSYVEGLGLFKSHECVQAMSFVPWIPRAEVDVHVQQMKAEGFPDYAVLSGGSLPPDPEGLSPITLLEPMNERNLRAFGRDMWEDPLRREAMGQARDTGNVVLSRKLTLYQEASTDPQPGLVLYAPVYRSQVPLDTVDQRRRAMLGWTTLVLRMGDFLESLLHEEAARMDIHIREGGPSDGGAVLFDSDAAVQAALGRPPHERAFEVGGRTWTLELRLNPNLVQLSDSRFRMEALVGGTLITLITCLIAILVTGSEKRARDLAEARGEELLATESQFRALFEKAPFGMAIVSSDSGRFQAANPRLGEILGYTPGELLERDFQSLTHPDHLASDLGSVRELAGGTISEIHKVKRYLHKDGHTVWARLRMVKLPGLEGEPPRHLSMVEDITERRQMEESLRQSESRFRLLAENAHDLVYWYRFLPEPGFEFISPSCKDLTGYSMEEFYQDGNLAMNILHPEDRLFIEGLLANQSFPVEPMLVRWIRKDGRLIWIEQTCSYLKDPEGRVTAVQAVARDVTDRVQAEQDLLESEARFRGVVEQSPVAIFLHEGGNFTFLNPAALRLFGTDRSGDLLGTPVLSRVHPEDLELVRQRIAQGFGQGRPHPILEQRLVALDGTCVEAEVQSIPVTYSGRTNLMVFAQDIGERKRAMAALAQSESNLADAQKIGRFGSWRVIYGDDQEAWSVSEGLRAIYGYTPDTQITMETGLEMMPPEDREAVCASWQASIRGSGPCAWEHRILVDGDIRWLSVRVKHLFSAEGRLVESSGIIQDITEKRAAEQALHANEARLRILSDQIPDSFLYQFSLDPTGTPRFGYVSAGVERLCGVKAQDVLQDPSQLFGQMDPAMLPAYQAAEAASARNLTSFTFEFRNRRADGEWRWFRVRSAPRKTQDGGLCWEGIATDITQQKLDQLRLEESEARFRSVVEQASDAIYLNDEEGHIILCNRAACTSTGFTMEEMLQLRIMDLDAEFVDPKNRQTVRHLRPFERATILARHKRKDGTTFPVEIHLSLFREEEPRQILAVVRDLTERGQVLEAELRARKAESLVLMAGGIAHDFNNLFQAIQGNLEIASMRAKGNGPFTQPLNQALVALNRAVSLSWKMLDFSGHGLMQMLPMNLEAWLPAYVDTLRLEFPPTFALEAVCEPVPPVLADRSKLEQVLKALLDNAQEAAQAPTSRVRLRLYVDFRADWPGPDSPGTWPLQRPELPATVCLELADDGPGVPSEKLDLVCDPFYTTRQPGRGLGLAAAVGILSAHRAGFHLFNGEDGGLVLRMHFPPGHA